MQTVYLASVSGGKDSTAMCLHLQDRGIQYRAVHFDTGWEDRRTIDYVHNVLPDFIGPIEIRRNEPALNDEQEQQAQLAEQALGFRSPFVRWILKKQIFPARVRRFCTQELKINVLRELVGECHSAQLLPVNVVGIRAAESKARSELLEREISTSLDCMVWRPILKWSEQQVIDLHRDRGVPPNPLYLAGAARVGCHPCIFARKSEVRMLDDARVKVIEMLEGWLTDAARQRDSAAMRRTFFQSARKIDGKSPPVSIREHIRWAETAKGSDWPDMQIGLPGLNDGCMRWGLCDLANDD